MLGRLDTRDDPAAPVHRRRVPRTADSAHFDADPAGGQLAHPDSIDWRRRAKTPFSTPPGCRTSSPTSCCSQARRSGARELCSGRDGRRRGRLSHEPPLSRRRDHHLRSRWKPCGAREPCPAHAAGRQPPRQRQAPRHRDRPRPRRDRRGSPTTPAVPSLRRPVLRAVLVAGHRGRAGQRGASQRFPHGCSHPGRGLANRKSVVPTVRGPWESLGPNSEGKPCPPKPTGS
ncbi:MAG: hypothetical protein JWQ81_3968 [Amycolatopsis sp.]|nr:hypothetical protein [Amycolatopsis sp.]